MAYAALCPKEPSFHRVTPRRARGVSLIGDGNLVIIAMANAAGLPMARDVHLASRLNQNVDLVRVMGTLLQT